MEGSIRKTNNLVGRKGYVLLVRSYWRFLVFGATYVCSKAAKYESILIGINNSTGTVVRCIYILVYRVRTDGTTVVLVPLYLAV
jgi:hypothetical protein